MIYVNGRTEPFVPSELTWSLQDVSQADSGRDMSGYMWKNTVTQKRKLQLKYNGLTWQRCSEILQAFSEQEYFSVTYPDMLSGEMETRTFYVGDREVPAYVWWRDKKIVSSLSFNIIER